MTSVMTSRRVPWVALALSFLSPGVGHLYCGRIAKGLPLYLAWLVVPLGITLAALLPPSPTMFVLLVLLPVVVVLCVYLCAAFDAWRLARLMGSDYVLRDYNRAPVYGVLIVVQMVYAIGLVTGVRGFVYEAFMVPGRSMSPTILNGDRILARKLFPSHHAPERGDLIVYRNPAPTGAEKFIGRVIAVGGDHLEIKGKRLFINSRELARARVPEERLRLLGDQMYGRVAFEENFGRRYLVAEHDSNAGGPIRANLDVMIPERHVFVLGDNRDRARDSRDFGSVHLADIVGYVEYIYWPAESWSRFGVANDRLP